MGDIGKTRAAIDVIAKATNAMHERNRNLSGRAGHDQTSAEPIAAERMKFGAERMGDGTYRVSVYGFTDEATMRALWRLAFGGEAV